MKTIIIRIDEHLSEDTTSVGLQFMEGNTKSRVDQLLKTRE